MHLERFLVHELAERARTTIRTIRYYTDEGLLPQPILQGKYAYYTPVHLNRLELIRQMKEAYLPLREIRQIIISLSDEEVKLRLDEKLAQGSNSEQEVISSQPDAGTGLKALEYISQLLDSQSAYRPKEISVPLHLQQRPHSSGSASPINDTTASIKTSANESETWQRILLAPGVELSLLEPIDPDTAGHVHQLISYAKKLFNSHQGGSK